MKTRENREGREAKKGKRFEGSLGRREKIVDVLRKIEGKREGKEE